MVIKNPQSQKTGLGVAMRSAVNGYDLFFCALIHKYTLHAQQQFSAQSTIRAQGTG